jgi:SAM-dependent MidA family methyltransferase
VSGLKARLVEEIGAEGPLTVARYMQACLFDPAAGYYATRPALGADGDFITAPESSQMFGELVGLWCAHEWSVLGSPSPVSLIEFGPGRGVLMADAWRAARVAPAFQAALRIGLIEPSLPLRHAQAEALAKVSAAATWFDDFDAAPDGPSLIIANEVLDCLPIRQFIATAEGWCERLIGAQQGELIFGLSHPIPAPMPDDTPEGYLREVAVGLEPFLAPVAARLNAAPGRALFFDYGYTDPEGADTLQALRQHQKAPVLAAPGEADLTAQVDFMAVAETAAGLGLDVHGPIAQGAFLQALGIAARAAALAEKHPARQEQIGREFNRLTAPDQMGLLFKAICLSSPGLPPPAGFPA